MNSRTLTFLVVDDEDLARTELCRLLGELLPSFVGIEAASVRQARELLLLHPVDGVFLDLEMPGANGMSLVPEIRAIGVPVIVTTAHDGFAVDAYDGDVADYLLKPIELSRLAKALGRIRKPDSISDSKLLVLGDQSNCWPIHPEEIVLVESSKNHVMLHLKDRPAIQVTRSMKEIEQLLDGNLFVRANRTQLVQLRCLVKIHRQDQGGNFLADLDGHGAIAFSRRQSQAFRVRFGF